MAFGFGKKKKEKPAKKSRRDDDVEDEELDLVMFQGATSGKEANLAANGKLVQIGLVPSKRLVTDALSRRAELIRLEPRGKFAAARFYIDGVPYSGGKLPGQQAKAMTQMLKLLSGLDVKDRTSKQSGGLNAEFGDGKYILTIESAPTKDGPERLIVRIKNTKESLSSPEELSFTDEMVTLIRKHSEKRRGIILACGPSGSGTTLSRYGILKAIDAYIFSIYSIADNTNHDVSIITQFDVNPDDTLETTIDRILRLECDVLFTDHINDEELAQTYFEYRDKVSIVSELAAPDTAAGIVKLIQLTGDPQKVADGLEIIFSQKLLRLLCDKCRDAFRPNPKLIRKVGLPPETRVLYRPLRPPEPSDEKGVEEVYIPCSKCNGLGFYGRTAIFEAIEMTDLMKDLVASNPDAAAIRKQAREEKMMSFQKEALRFVAEGITSLDEVQRIFSTK